jgi:hypothetical protein
MAVYHYRIHAKQPDATIKDISTHDVAKWAFHNVATNARSNLGQQFSRALSRNDEWRDGYAWLLGEQKKEFRLLWAAARDWNFTRESKTIITSKKKALEDLGEHLPEVTIAARLGSAESAECKRMASAYAARCRSLGAPWTSFDSFLDCDTFLFIRKLSRATNEKEWRMLSEQVSQEESPLWQQRVREGKALQKFAYSKNLKLADVTLDMVKADVLGIDGWADAAITIAMINNSGSASSSLAPTPAPEATPKKKAKREPHVDAAAAHERDL